MIHPDCCSCCRQCCCLHPTIYLSLGKAVTPLSQEPNSQVPSLFPGISHVPPPADIFTWHGDWYLPPRTTVMVPVGVDQSMEYFVAEYRGTVYSIHCPPTSTSLRRRTYISSHTHARAHIHTLFLTRPLPNSVLAFSELRHALWVHI